jgi:hypothetical protein
MAVGAMFNPSGNQLTLAEHWNGTSWTVVPTPNPAGTNAGALSGISCTSSTACTAVGQYTSPTTGLPETLAEAWNGMTWSIQPTPNPSNAAGATLSGVSCRADGTCIAVGSYQNTTLGTGVTLAEMWNGSAWSISSTPNPPGGTHSSLSSVSCAGGRNCTAVGTYETGTNPLFATLAEAWNGTSWSISATLNHRNSRSDGLLGVSCGKDGARCYAVGYYRPQDGVNQPLVEASNSGTWSIQRSYGPAHTPSQLNRVSCVWRAGACAAVGGIVNSADSGATLAESLSIDHWVLQATPAQPALPTLSAVSCSTSSDCMAVGSVTHHNETQSTLAELFTG